MYQSAKVLTSQQAYQCYDADYANVEADILQLRH